MCYVKHVVLSSTCSPQGFHILVYGDRIAKPGHASLPRLKVVIFNGTQGVLGSVFFGISNVPFFPQ
jgi:hypothetical protein